MDEGREGPRSDLLAAAVAAAETVDDALAACAAAIARTCGWSVARALAMDAAGDLVSRGWYLSDPERFEPFRAVSEVTDIASGAPGVALREGRPLWSEDLDGEPAFLRRRAASLCGLRGGAFLPVAVDTEPIGVIEVYAEQRDDVVDPSRRSRTLELVEQAARLLGAKRHERGMAAAEERFHAVFDGPVGAVLLDSAMNVVEANAALARMLGRTPEWLRGRPLDSLAQPAVSGGLPSTDLRLRLERDAQVTFEAELAVAGGSVDRVSIRAWKVARSGATAYAALFDPQLERRRAADAAAARAARRRAAVAMLRTLVDEPKLLSAIAECVRSVLDARYACVALGRNDGRSLVSVVTAGVPPEHEGSAPAPRGVLSAYLLEGRPLRLADVGSHPAVREQPDGALETTSFIGVPLVDRSDTIGHLIGADRDNGEPFDELDEAALLDLASIATSELLRVRSAAQARAASSAVRRLVRANLELLHDAQPEMLPKVAVDMLRTVVDAEHAALLLIDPATGDTTAFLHSGLAPAAAARIGPAPSARGLLGAALQAGRPTRLADLRGHPAHRGFPADHPEMRSFLAVPVVGREGPAGLLFCTNKQTSVEFSASDEEAARRIAESIERAIAADPRQGEEILHRLAATSERLREHEEARWRFLGSLSHELRSSVAGMIMSAEVLSDPDLGSTDEETTRAMGGRIVSVGRTLMTLLDNMLDLSRAQSNRLDVRLQPLNVEPVVKALLRDLEQQVDDAGLLVDIAPHPTLPRVLADPVRLRQVLVNLLTNAIKFTPPGGHVWLEMSSNEHDATIAVCDTGVGIDPADLERLFEPFERGSGGRADGAGLGLAIARAIVELHGGRLEATSWPGVGSRFAATFRVARGPHLTPAFDDAIEEHEQLVPGSGRILVVEDDLTSRETTSAVLLAAGYDVRGVTTCAEAVDAVSEWAPDLVLLDVQLPDGDGLDAVDALRTRAGARALPIYAFTADRMGDTEERAMTLCDAFLLKPVAPRELLRRVRLGLENPAARPR